MPPTIATTSTDEKPMFKQWIDNDDKEDFNSNDPKRLAE
ncbi:hypothetical protein HNR39_003180 [Glaciimonas immobilis]|uniref:Uncharacterized protein n=1 Tax=Glaciimonas immobilis TaxID=728004 RepID=A0A840RXR9_9BURK|nr:hypothetical protein [Glaciimonas immobilis]